MALMTEELCFFADNSEVYIQPEIYSEKTEYPFTEKEKGSPGRNN